MSGEGAAEEDAPMTQTTTETTIPTVNVGDGAAIYGFSDIYAATVIAVSANGKTVTLQRDEAILLNGTQSGAADALTFSPGGFLGHTSGEQRYEFKADPKGATDRFSLRSVNGRAVWVRVGESARGGQRATIGRRYHHYDFNF
jgi:hypothetical protein